MVKKETFIKGFNAGLYARATLEDVPEIFSMYFFQYPDAIGWLGTGLKKVSEKHLEQIKRENKEMGIKELFIEDKHSIYLKYEQNCNTFAEKTDFLCGFFSAIIVQHYFKTKELKKEL